MTPDPTEIGRYRVVARIGHGGMGVLYRAIDPVLDREVAIKRLITDFGAEGVDARERFFSEAKAAARLQHRNIVTVFDYGEEQDVGFIVMELLRGESLATRMKRAPRLTLTEALDIVIELCTGLDFAHRRGVVHRDIKPGNVWLTEEDTVKLLDFGIARLLTATSTNHGDILGTVAYLAPERLTGEADARADIFSAAVVLFELVTGQRPFDSNSPTGVIHRLLNETPPLATAIDPSLPTALANAVAKGLQRDPGARFQSAADFALELESIRLALSPQDDPAARSGDFTSYGSSAPLASAADVTLQRAPSPDPQSSAVAGRKGSGLSAWLGPALVAGALVLGAIGSWTWTRRAPEPVLAVAPAEPAVTRLVSLNVVSDPVGAAIRVDGRDTGFVTPHVLSFPDGSAHIVEVAKPGFVSAASHVSAAEYSDGVVQIRLVADPQVKPVRRLPLVALAGGNYEFEVWDGRARLAAASARHELLVTRGQKLRLVSQELFLDQEVRAQDLEAGEVRTPALGLLKVSVPVSASYGGCPVYVDGVHFGDVGRQREITSGMHTVELRCGGDARLLPAPVQVFVRPGSSPTEVPVG